MPDEKIGLQVSPSFELQTFKYLHREELLCYIHVLRWIEMILLDRRVPYINICIMRGKFAT